MTTRKYDPLNRLQNICPNPKNMSPEQPSLVPERKSFCTALLNSIPCGARKFLQGVPMRIGILFVVTVGLICIATVSGCASVPNCGDGHACHKTEQDKTERAIISAEQDVALMLRFMDFQRKKRAKLDGERGGSILPARVETAMNQARDSHMSNDEYLRILKQCYEDLARRTDAKHAELGVYYDWLRSSRKP